MMLSRLLYESSTLSALGMRIGSTENSSISYERSTSSRVVTAAGKVVRFFTTEGAAPAFGTWTVFSFTNSEWSTDLEAKELSANRFSIMDLIQI